MSIDCILNHGIKQLTDVCVPLVLFCFPLPISLIKRDKLGLQLVL